LVDRLAVSMATQSRTQSFSTQIALSHIERRQKYFRKAVFRFFLGKFLYQNECF
jgi:hypothetical protein